MTELQPFETFGEMTMFSAETHVVSIRAQTAVHVLQLRRADFDHLHSTKPEVACQLACNIVSIVSERLRNVDNRLSQILDQHEVEADQQLWQDVRARLSKLQGGYGAV